MLCQQAKTAQEDCGGQDPSSCTMDLPAPDLDIVTNEDQLTLYLHMQQQQMMEHQRIAYLPTKRNTQNFQNDSENFVNPQSSYTCGQIPLNLKEFCQEIRVRDSMPQLMQGGSKSLLQEFGSVEFPQNPSLLQYFIQSKPIGHHDDGTALNNANLQFPLLMGQGFPSMSKPEKIRSAAPFREQIEQALFQEQTFSPLNDPTEVQINQDSRLKIQADCKGVDQIIQEGGRKELTTEPYAKFNISSHILKPVHHTQSLKESEETSTPDQHQSESSNNPQNCHILDDSFSHPDRFIEKMEDNQVAKKKKPTLKQIQCKELRSANCKNGLNQQLNDRKRIKNELNSSAFNQNKNTNKRLGQRKSSLIQQAALQKEFNIDSGIQNSLSGNSIFELQAQFERLQEQVNKNHVKITKCPHCNKDYKRKKRLLVHFETAHLLVPSKFVCKFEGCAKRFTEKGNLKVHERIHTHEVPYQCSHCDRRFSSIGNRRDHERRHLKDRPYNCRICDRGFYRKYLLKKHLVGFHNYSSAELSLNSPLLVSTQPRASPSSRASIINREEQSSSRRAEGSHNNRSIIQITNNNDQLAALIGANQGQNQILKEKLIQEQNREPLSIMNSIKTSKISQSMLKKRKLQEPALAQVSAEEQKEHAMRKQPGNKRQRNSNLEINSNEQQRSKKSITQFIPQNSQTLQIIQRNQSAELVQEYDQQALSDKNNSDARHHQNSSNSIFGPTTPQQCTSQRQLLRGTTTTSPIGNFQAINLAPLDVNIQATDTPVDILNSSQTWRNQIPSQNHAAYKIFPQDNLQISRISYMTSNGRHTQ
ncbi:hypothetical protein FGO68_gene11187 [Halteria grandinella]|uniref:C2H2-type domain-containing protein n=1 Tax=Halteria grandinella TaxID=5974 RepID=A0A8J8T7V0_HALGN|nr:hypothetical protein FGO68_gene11187 [Halteria grandinella]